ncbi:MAG: class I SAM-dependent methyltransferase [Devosia nanyangense]|uniref:Class I SAM-dependent methyltransferase n=1 Tax=Devosia nanyangense TaxID=1228055 RepID=A0A933L2J2_9HYPH|nr:class I SAM-dependent methyltransferase [Devosia nanyangense]
MVRGKDVLDIACGEGYGASYMSQVAASVTGVDVSPGAVRHANREYGSDRTRFMVGDGVAIPSADASFDVVTSFETIEHIADQNRFLAEIKRVLRPGGLLIASSPESRIYSPVGSSPNQFHVNELTAEDFRTLLAANFAEVQLVGQLAMIGSAIVADDATQGGSNWTFERRGADAFEASRGLPKATYIIALASDRLNDRVAGSIYVERNEPYWRPDKERSDMETTVANLRRQVAGLTAQVEQLKREAAGGKGRSQRKQSKPAGLLPADRQAVTRRFLDSITLQVLCEEPQASKSLVFVQCGSTFDRRSLTDRDRPFDLLLNLYDNATPRRVNPGANIVCAQPGSKCTAIATLLQQRPDLLDRYDHVLFLDDDVAISTEGVERLFEAMARDDLHLVQPSLTAASPCAWPALKQPSVGQGRVMVSSVEIMMPCLSRAALRAAGWVFGTSVSGWGTDVLLGAYLSRTHGYDAYVLGDVVAEHERAIDTTRGPFYRFLESIGVDPNEELNAILRQYGLERMIRRFPPVTPAAD